MATAAAAMHPDRIGQRKETGRRTFPETGYAPYLHWQRRVISVHGHLANSLMTIIMSEENLANAGKTHGDRNPAKTSLRALAEEARRSEEAIRVELKKLEADELIEPVKAGPGNGRGNKVYYHAHPENAKRLADRADRPLKKLGPRRQAAAVSTSQISGGGRKHLRFLRAQDGIDFVNPLPDPLTIELRESDSAAPSLTFTPPAQNDDRVEHPDAHRSNTQSALGVFGSNDATKGHKARLGELRDALTPRLLRHCGKEPDDGLLDRIEGKLGAATLRDYFRHLDRRLKRGGQIESGLFILIAGEVSAAALKMQPPAPVPPITTDPAPVFTGEPEDADTPWSRIRRELKLNLTVAPQEYENWLRRTSFESFSSGKLSVRVPDQVTADFIDQEYRGHIITAARAVGLEVSELHCLPSRTS